MKFFSVHVVAAAALAVAGMSAAQAQSLASIQLDLSDLKVEMVSLAPDAPALAPPTISLFSSADPSGSNPATGGLQSLIWRGTTETATFVDRVPVSSALWPTESLTQLSPDGVSQSTISPTSISMSTRLTEQAVQSVLPGYGPNFDQRFVSLVNLYENTDYYGGSLGNANAWQVTLAPQSQLTMSGVSNTSLSMDLDSASRVLSPLADSETIPSLVLVAGLYLEAQILDPVDGVSATSADIPGSEIQYFFDTDQAFQWTGVNTGPLVQQQNNFNLTLRNELDVEKTFLVSMFAYNETVVYGGGRPGPIDEGGGLVPEIPEPSTYALMGLGLVGLAAVARKGRLNKPH